MVLSQHCADFGDHGEPYHRFSRSPQGASTRRDFLGVLEAEFPGDHYPVIADEQCALRPFDQNRPRARAERDPNRIGPLGRTGQDPLTGGGAKEDLLMRHRRPPAGLIPKMGYAPRPRPNSASSGLPSFDACREAVHPSKPQTQRLGAAARLAGEPQQSLLHRCLVGRSG
jgi:hypothetical protein